MDYIRLGRAFDRVWNNNWAIHLEATVQNVFVITGYQGHDPEVINGLDSYMYPRARTFSLSVKVSY